MYGPGHVCDIPAKRHLVHDGLLRRSSQPLSSEPNRARQFQSRTTLRDDHHSCNHYLRSSPRHAAPASIRYYELFMATYFITGIAGFIGSALARAVLVQGDQVRGIDNLSTGKTENIAEILNRIDFREADLLDMKPVESACTGSDYVLHQAAIPSVPKFLLDPPGSNGADVDVTVDVLVAARHPRVERVL